MAFAKPSVTTAFRRKTIAMQSLLINPKRNPTGRHRRGPITALLALLVLLAAPATAWSTDVRQAAATVPGGDTGLPATTLDDRVLAQTRARNAEGNTPIGGNRRTGVTLWDEGGSPTPSGQRRNHSGDGDNRQTHSLTLGN